MGLKVVSAFIIHICLSVVVTQYFCIQASRQADRGGGSWFTAFAF